MGVMELDSSAGNVSRNSWAPPSLPASLIKNVTKDFHKSNLKHLKKLSLRNKEQAAAAAEAAAAAAAAAEESGGGPIRANHNIAGLPSPGKKKYEHVKARIMDWKPRPGKTDFLKGHQKTGPFLPVSSASNSVEDLTEQAKPRFTNLRYSKSLREVSSDYGTMSQGGATVPPLNFEDDVSIHLAGSRAGSRFSEVSLQDRRDRITSMINEISATMPITNGSYQPGVAGRGLNDCMKKCASVDQVSDAGCHDRSGGGGRASAAFNATVMGGSGHAGEHFAISSSRGGGGSTAHHVNRPGCCGRLDTGMGNCGTDCDNWRKERDSNNMKRFASSPKLSQTNSGTLPRNKKTRAGKKPPTSAAHLAPLSTSSSMVNLSSGYGGTLPRQKKTAPSGVQSPRKARRALPKTPPTKKVSKEEATKEAEEEVVTNEGVTAAKEDIASVVAVVDQAEEKVNLKEEEIAAESTGEVEEAPAPQIDADADELEEAAAHDTKSMDFDSLNDAPVEPKDRPSPQRDLSPEAPTKEATPPPREPTLEEVFPPTNRRSLVRHSPVRHLPIRHSPMRQSPVRDSPPRSDRGSRESSVAKEEPAVQLVKGTDVDYVLANTELVGEAGHHLRKASRERERKESESSSKSETPSDYKMGKIPNYLQERREKWRAEAEAAEKKRKESEGCPEGHVLLTESQRLQGLHKLKTEYKNVLAEMARFPVRSDTLRARQRRSVLEKDVERIEEGIRTYEKQKVFVLKSEDGSPILEGIDDNNNGADRKESGFSVASGWDGGIFGDRKASKGPAFFDRKASGASVTAADRKSTTGSVVFAQDIEFA